MKEEKPLKKKGHHNRDDLAGEHVFGDLGQVILMLLFLTAWIIDSFVIRYSIFLSETVPLIVRLSASFIVFLVAGYLAKVGLRIVFGEVREEPVVIRQGVFNIIRHPVYLGAMLFYLGMLIMTFSIIAAIIFLFIIAFYHFIAKKEEEILLEKFGKDYEAYMKEVPMWLPRSRKK